MRRKAPNQFRPFLAIAYYSLRALFRNRATVFFGFAFPLIFIGAFGLFGGNSQAITIGILENQQSGAVYEALANIKPVDTQEGSREELVDKLSQGRLSGILLREESGEYVVLTSQADPQEASVVSSLVSGVVDRLNLKLSGVKNPPIRLSVKEISGRDFKFIDFFLPGMIGFALLATAINSTSFGLIFLKKTLVLKRIFATPTKGPTILLGQGAARMVMVLLQTLVIILVGVFVFGFTLVHGFLTLTQVLILSIIGLFAFLGFGLFVAGVANDENTAAPLANIIFLPQFLVAGTFFPIESLPGWIQPIVSALPLAFFNTAIRKITVEGLSFEALVPQLVGLAVWAVLAYTASAKTFRWE